MIMSATTLPSIAGTRQLAYCLKLLIKVTAVAFSTVETARMAERTGLVVKRMELRANVLTDVLVIFGIWSGLIALFFLLGRAGYGVGLLVPTLGEDQNWVALLHARTPHDIANGFWNLDGRNPLSPWFYILAKPIIGLHGGISILLYLVSLLLSLATYALLSLIMRGQARWYVLSTSAIVAVNQSNAYFDHIIWNFQVALACTILAISAYLHFLDSERRSVWAYGSSLVLWCVNVVTGMSPIAKRIEIAEVKPLLHAKLNSR